MKTEQESLWDAIAVNIVTSRIRIFGTNKTKSDAEAISNMAVIRRGCEKEFYTEVPTDTYKDGDTYQDNQ